MTSYPAQYFGSATPIINQTNVGSNTLSAQITSGGGGGGGGGGGPNPSVSSLTINNFSANANGALAFAYDVPSQLNTLPANSIGLTQAVVKDSAGNNTNSLISFVNNGGSNVTADFASARVIVGSQGTGASASAKGTIAYDATANLMTFSPASISSLSVSSINGATPGGGGPATIPANLTASTLTLNYSTLAGANMSVDGGGNSRITILAPSTNVSYVSMNLQDANSAQTSFVDVVAIQDAGAINFGTTGGALSQIYMDATGVSISTLKSQSLNVSSINGSPVGFSYATGSVSSIGSLPIANSVVSRAGKNQTVQFQFVYASTSTASNAGYIDMLASQMAPGNWRWQSQPSVTLNGITSSGACVPIGANAQLSGDPGDLSQDLACSFQFVDSNVPTNILLTMNGIAYN